MLIATDATGGVNAIAVVVTVTAPQGSDTPPIARFTWNCAGQQYAHQCALDASGSTDDVGIVSYRWAWGNGRSETKTMPAVRNTWASSGVFPVTLTVTDTKGQTNTLTASVLVP